MTTEGLDALLAKLAELEGLVASAAVERSALRTENKQLASENAKLREALSAILGSGVWQENDARVCRICGGKAESDDDWISHSATERCPVDAGWKALAPRESGGGKE